MEVLSGVLCTLPDARRETMMALADRRDGSARDLLAVSDAIAHPGHDRTASHGYSCYSYDGGPPVADTDTPIESAQELQRVLRLARLRDEDVSAKGTVAVSFGQVRREVSVHALIQALGPALVDGTAPAEETWTPAEAARHLGVSRPMVYRYIEQGLLEDRPVGSHHRIPVASAHALAASRRASGRRAVEALNDPAQQDRVAAARERARARVEANRTGATA